MTPLRRRSCGRPVPRWQCPRLQHRFCKPHRFYPSHLTALIDCFHSLSLCFPDCPRSLVFTCPSLVLPSPGVFSRRVSLTLCQFSFVLCFQQKIKNPSISWVIMKVPSFPFPAVYSQLRLCLVSLPDCLSDRQQFQCTDLSSSKDQSFYPDVGLPSRAIESYSPVSHPAGTQECGCRWAPANKSVGADESFRWKTLLHSLAVFRMKAAEWHVLQLEKVAALMALQTGSK